MVCRLLPDGGFVETPVLDQSAEQRTTKLKQKKLTLLPVEPSGGPVRIEVDPYRSLIRNTVRCTWLRLPNG